MMMPYHNSPRSEEDEETAIPLIPTILPSTRTTMTTTSMSYRSTKVRMIVIFAGVMLLLVVAGGASSTYDVTPRRVPNKQSKKTTKPLVTNPPITQPPVIKPPVNKPPVTKPPVIKPPVTNSPTKGPVVTLGSLNFNDNAPCLESNATFIGVSTTTSWGKGYAFETCYKYGTEKKYCWSKSYKAVNGKFFECHPNGDQWDGLEGDDMKNVPDGCGLACKGMYQAKSF